MSTLGHTTARQSDVIGDILQRDFSLAVLDAAGVLVDNRGSGVVGIVLTVGAARLSLLGAAGLLAVGIHPQLRGASVEGDLGVLSGSSNVHCCAC